MSTDLPPNEQPRREESPPPTGSPTWGWHGQELPRHHRWQRGGSAPWGALFLILLGLIFLASNVGLFTAIEQVLNLHFNWWALFLLIPIVSIGARLVNSMQASGGRITRDARGSLIWLMIMIIVFGALAFNLDWGKIWPFFLIAAGLGTLLAAVTDR
ncbi:MAG: hypothetical protein Kow00124_31180 [Anaerolineae bacterium]